MSAVYDAEVNVAAAKYPKSELMPAISAMALNHRYDFRLLGNTPMWVRASVINSNPISTSTQDFANRMNNETAT